MTAVPTTPPASHCEHQRANPSSPSQHPTPPATRRCDHQPATPAPARLTLTVPPRALPAPLARLRALAATPARALRLPFAALSLALASGCSLLPEAKPDPTRHYLLASSAAPAAAAPAGAPTVHLRPIELANYLRARAMVVRRGANEIEFREFAQWGEPLDLGLARALRGELHARGTTVNVGNTRSARLGTDLELALRVHAFEGHAAGTASIHATWEISDEKGLRHRGEFRTDSARWDGKTEASLAAALSESLAALAAELAPSLAKKP